MNAPVHRKAVARACALVGFALIGSTVVGTARERPLRPRFVAFASVARGAELEALATDNLRPSERAFLREASEFTRRELRMAQLGVSQATSSDLRSFAQQVVTDYRQISNSLDALVRNKGVALLITDQTPTERFDRLAEKSGADFDREFLRTSAKASEDALKLFERAVEDAKDTDVHDLAGSYLPALRAHLNTVKALEKSLE